MAKRIWFDEVVDVTPADIEKMNRMFGPRPRIHMPAGGSQVIEVGGGRICYVASPSWPPSMAKEIFREFWA